MDPESVTSVDDKKQQISSVLSLLDQVQAEPTLHHDARDNGRSSNAVTQSQPVYRLYRRRFFGVVGLS